MSLVSLRNLGYAGPAGDPVVKALAELQGLTITGPVTGATGGSAIAVVGIEPEDTILNITNLTDLTAVNLAHVTIADRRAVGTLTIGAAVTDGDTVVVNGKTYTFTDVEEPITYNAAPGIVPFQTDPSGANDTTATAARLARAIMSNDSQLTVVAALAVVTIYYRTPGTGGNSKTLSVAGSNAHVTKSATTLLGGTATSSISCSDSTATKQLLIFWLNKTP